MLLLYIIYLMMLLSPSFSSEANELAVQIAETVSGGSKFATLREYVKL